MDNAFLTSRILRMLAGVSSILFLSSCAEDFTDFSQMSAEIEQTLSAEMKQRDKENALATAGFLDFESAISDAVLHNESYLAALVLEQEMIENINFAKSQRRLNVTAKSTLGGLREETEGTSSQNTLGVVASVQMSKLIFDGGESASIVDLATTNALKARLERLTLGNKLANDAALVWIDVWQYQNRIELLKVRSAELNELTTKLERMGSLGLIDRSSLDSIRSKVVDLTIDESRIKADYRQSALAFNLFFNSKVETLPKPFELQTMTKLSSLDTFGKEAPILQLSVVDLIAAKNALLKAQAAFKPNIRTQFGLVSPMGENQDIDMNLGLVLEYTFGDGGRRKSQLKSAQLSVESSEMALLNTRRSFASKLDIQIDKLNALKLNLPLADKKIKLSALEFETLESQLKTGQASLSQLVVSKIENYQARDRKIILVSEILSLEYEILSQTGDLAAALGLNFSAQGKTG